MRWLYHIVPRETSLEEVYSPPSLAREGFVHASFQGAVLESARLHFPPGAALAVLRIDPRRLDVSVEVADTPRGPMPHIHGPIPGDAIRAVLLPEEMAAAPDRVTGTRFGLVAFPGMTLLDLVGVYDPLSRISSMGFDPRSTCEIVSACEERIPARDGLRLTVERVRPPLFEFDVVVVPGGRGARALASDAAVVAWLAAFPKNRLLASVCTGALLLGAAGRLQGRRATTHHTALDELAAFSARAVRERVVDEGAVVTAAGVTCAIDLGLHLVRRIEGDETAGAIARQMEWSPQGPERRAEAAAPR